MITSVLLSLLLTVRGVARSRAALYLEVLALRHQVQVLQRSRPRRLPLRTADRWLWVWLSRVWTAWRTALVIVRPQTVVGWPPPRLPIVWTWKSRRRTEAYARSCCIPRLGGPAPGVALRRSAAQSFEVAAGTRSTASARHPRRYHALPPMCSIVTAAILRTTASRICASSNFARSASLAMKPSSTKTATP
jgi:hypothetical protein